MNRFRKKITTPVFILIVLMIQISFSQDNVKNDSWKIQLQMFLGFSGEEVDGILGEATFNSLKKFAIKHDLTDVVLRGEFEDIEYWGFEQYLIKYQAYWIRELKNQQIMNDVRNKHYIRQADETLYSFEIAIQNAQLEVERLVRAKTKAQRLAQGKKELQMWEIEKQEAERLTAELQQAILIAEEKANKWSLERLKAKRLAAEQEQLERLNARKEEATRLTIELEDIISSAKKEIDRLIDENKKMQKLIESSEKTEERAEQLNIELTKTNENLLEAQAKIQVLSIQKDTLENKLQDAKIEIENMLKQAVTSIDSQKQVDETRWYHNFGLNINNNNLINHDTTGSFMVTPTINIDVRYHLPWKPVILNKEMDWDIILEYSPSFTYENSSPLLAGTIQNQFSLIWKLNLNLKLGIVNLSKFEEDNYISFSSEIGYKLPFKYKFISSSYFLSPHIMKSLDGYKSMTYFNTGLRITLD